MSCLYCFANGKDLLITFCGLNLWVIRPCFYGRIMSCDLFFLHYFSIYHIKSGVILHIWDLFIICLPPVEYKLHTRKDLGSFFYFCSPVPRAVSWHIVSLCAFLCKYKRMWQLYCELVKTLPNYRVIRLYNSSVKQVLNS